MHFSEAEDLAEQRIGFRVKSLLLLDQIAWNQKRAADTLESILGFLRAIPIGASQQFPLTNAGKQISSKINEVIKQIE